jgi:hypothetical protein
LPYSLNGDVAPSENRSARRFFDRYRGIDMKMTVVSFVLAAFTGQASAATCIAQANDKKLRSHAQESFMQKCEADAKKACESLAKTKKLADSAKRSFVKKCVADAVGVN